MLAPQQLKSFSAQSTSVTVHDIRLRYGNNGTEFHPLEEVADELTHSRYSAGLQIPNALDILNSFSEVRQDYRQKCIVERHHL